MFYMEIFNEDEDEDQCIAGYQPPEKQIRQKTSRMDVKGKTSTWERDPNPAPDQSHL